MSETPEPSRPASVAAAQDAPPRPIKESVEEAAGEKLGVGRWDRPRIFRDTAAAATEADLPYWLLLILSGAIATLGLAIDSSAVVIGAMLVAPLLAPVLGLGMALAVGDGRLALQAGSVVALSTVAVVATGALLTLALPFQTITLEISQRTQPTTLDLAIAVFSGLVGAVVTVSRGQRLSAVIPGVAIAVALIPPLAVAGFGVGAGWNFRLIHGALLLYGANLGGIVLSGMMVFLLIGMQRPRVFEEARRWHAKGQATGIANWVTRARWARSVGMMESPWKRITLVLAFVIAVAVPLSETLGHVARERRVRDAVEAAADLFQVPGRSSMVSRQVVLGDGQAQVYLRLATAERFDSQAQEEFERVASAAAREPITVILEQLLTSREDLDQTVELPVIPSEPRPSALATPSPQDATDLIRRSMAAALDSLPLPLDARIAGGNLSLADRGGEFRFGYLSETPMGPDAERMLESFFSRRLALEGTRVHTEHVPASFGPLGIGEAAHREVDRAGELLRRYSRLRGEIEAGTDADEELLSQIRSTLDEASGGPGRVEVTRSGDGSDIILRLVSDSIQ